MREHAGTKNAVVDASSKLTRYPHFNMHSGIDHLGL
jgi:hypothetical protein